MARVASGMESEWRELTVDLLVFAAPHINIDRTREGCRQRWRPADAGAASSSTRQCLAAKSMVERPPLLQSGHAGLGLTPDDLTESWQCRSL